jgi:hypothetical protein
MHRVRALFANLGGSEMRHSLALSILDMPALETLSLMRIDSHIWLMPPTNGEDDHYIAAAPVLDSLGPKLRHLQLQAFVFD